MPKEHAVTRTVTRYLRDVNHRATISHKRFDPTNHMETQKVSTVFHRSAESNEGGKTEGLHNDTQHA